VGVFLVLVGFLVNATCGVFILVKAFKASVGWGLAVLFIPFASLIFVFNNWQDCKNPFLGGIAGAVLIFLGAILGYDADEAKTRVAESRPASRSTAPSRGESEEAEETPQPANYASAAAPSYQPRTAYTPAYNPPQQPPPATDTQVIEDEWTRTPKFEQVYVDRKTNQFYEEKCKKKPEDAYRIPRSVALMQGIVEAKCK
jgi:hypothetical protein